MTRTLLSDLVHLLDHESSPVDRWPPHHAPVVDAEQIVTERKRALEMIEAGEAKERAA